MSSEDGPAARALASGRLVQPDATTCGSCVLVVARMLHDPAYAALVAEDLPARFRAEALEVHRTTSAVRGSGGWQLPWPRSLGTQPWALAAEMSSRAGEPGRRYAVRPVLPRDRAATWARLGALATDGHAVPLYVGNAWSPRHVLLVLAQAAGPGDGDRLTVYDPASGRTPVVSASDFTAATLTVAGWRVPWLVVPPV